MNRRQVLKTGLGLGSAALLSPPLLVSCTKPQPENLSRNSYRVGERISAEAFVFDSELGRHAVLELCRQSDAKIVVLAFYGGGAMQNTERVGGIWCPDSFEDLQILRYINFKYKSSEVTILPVACAPVYSTRFYWPEDGVFLNEPDDSPKFKEVVDAFVNSTEAAVSRRYVPVKTYYDFRLRNLFNRRKDLEPGEGYGPVHDWQGRFRASGDSQKYGTPTFWLLDKDGTVLAEPFYGNLYHEAPFEIRFSVIDVDGAIQGLL